MIRVRWFICAGIISMATMLSACDGGGDSNDPPQPPPPPVDPVEVTLSIDDAELTEGDSGEVDLAFTVSASPAPPSDISVDYSTADDSAQAGSDYTAVSGTLTVAAGATDATLVVVVSGDVEVESDETFTVTIDSATSASDVTVTIGASTGTGLIRNNDAAA